MGSSFRYRNFICDAPRLVKQSKKMFLVKGEVRVKKSPSGGERGSHQGIWESAASYEIRPSNTAEERSYNIGGVRDTRKRKE